MPRVLCLVLLALPLQAADFLIRSYTLTSSNFSLTFPTRAGRVYEVEGAESLGQTWTIQATYCGRDGVITFSGPLQSSAAFYRVSDSPSPPLQLSPSDPVLTSAAVSLPDAVMHEAYAVDITVCPSGTAPFSFQISGAPPAGLVLSLTSDSVQVRGAPISLTRTEFEVTVTDATSATARTRYNIRAITPPPAILPETVTLKSGRAANFALSGSGGTSNLAWSVDSGNLPDGIALATAGFLVGTPSADAAESNETGVHAAIVRVRDQHTDRVTGAPTPRTATAAITTLVHLSYNLNIFADRINGPSLTSRCYGCHNEFFPPNVTSGDAADIIGSASNPAFSCPNRVYITPNQPQQSLIYKKLTAPPCGDRMPFGGPYMTDLESNRILRWIVELQPGDQD